MTKARPALASEPLLAARGLLSLALGACAFAQNARPPDTINPSLFQLQHTSWTERDGAPPAIHGIAQAPDGSLWVGSGEGLYRFDGFTFERIGAIDGDSPAPVEVYCLLARSNGDLWIGTSFNGTVLLRNGVAKRFPKFEGIPPNTTVSKLREDLDGTIWAGTSLGLQRFDGSQWRSAGKAWGLPEMTQFAYLQLDSNGTLWAEASKQRLFRLKRGSRRFERLPDLRQEFLSFDQSPSGEYWGSTSLGVCPLTEVLNGTAGSHCVVHDNLSARPAIHADLDLTFDRRGNLWMRSFKGGGIERLDAATLRDAFRPGHPEGKMESLAKRDGLTSDIVWSIFQDRRDKSIWLGTDHGLDHFREPSFLPTVPKPGFSDFGVQARKDGSVWIGSPAGGGLWIASPAGRVERATIPSLSVQSLYETGRGILWVATYSASAIQSIVSIRDDPGSEKTISVPLPPELQSQVAVQSIIEDRDGALWASFLPYGLAKWEGGHWIKNGGLTGLPEAWVVILSTGPDGKVWAGYMNGEAAVIEGTSVRRFSAKDGLNIGPVAAILSGPSGCWLAGVNGLVRFDGQRFHILLEANNRPFTGTTGIAEARNGDLWLNEWEGVRRVAAAELRRAEKNPAYAVHSDLYDLTDGLPSVPQRIRPFPTAVSAADGRIWFGLRSGVVSIDPEDPRLRIPAPPVSIVRAIADGKSFNGATNAKFAARTKNLEIDYTAASLNRASRVRFRYKLENVDAGWRDAGSRRQAFYNNLPPGKYRFVVSASNGDNLWNEAGATMNMEVPPAFNQTTWFLAACVAGLLVLLAGLYRLRIRYLEHQFNIRLEERIGERTRIARELHDTLLQSFHGLLFQFQTVDNLLPARPGEAKKTLESALDDAAQAITEARDAVHELRSSSVVTNDLAAAVTALGEELAAHHATSSPSQDSPTFLVEVEGTPQDLHPILRDEIYRIAGEGLRNAFNHARARRIEVDIRYDERELRVRIRDDGSGIDPSILSHEGRAGHWGLTGMRERAERIGGNMDLWSEPGAGTEVELRIPASIVYQTSAGRGFRLFS
jgi:signal transduction histidine kinase/ligand-binding sensor domain-containing protein